MHVSRLVVYPVKSCAGVSVDSWDLDSRGLRHDRSFMVVDADGRFLTQREQPRLALIRPQVIGAELILRVDDVGSVGVPLQPTGPRTAATVWEYTGPAIDTGDRAADLISTHLGVPARLVAMPLDHARTADPHYAPPGRPVSFADGFPLLLVGEASLDDLNSRLAEPLPMDRFRPNVVIAGSLPFAEDQWTHIRIGEVPVDVVKPCTRCTITTVDQATGVLAGAEPLRTLGTFRRADRGVVFGQNAVHRHSGTLTVGAPVRE